MGPQEKPSDDTGFPAEGRDATPRRRRPGQAAPRAAGAWPPEVVRPSPEEVRRIRELSLRSLSAEEFEALVRSPVSPEEEAANLELIRWFCRRYPTPAERLAYVRRAYSRWKRWMPDPGGPGGEGH